MRIRRWLARGSALDEIGLRPQPRPEFLINWFARRGAVGGTARWAAKLYEFFRQRHPSRSEFPDNAIFRLMVVTRFENLPNEVQEQYLLSTCDSFQGLVGLVVEILKVEAGLHENHGATVADFVRIIDEELERKGISEIVRRGNCPDIEPFVDQAFTPPSL